MGASRLLLHYFGCIVVVMKETWKNYKPAESHWQSITTGCIKYTSTWGRWSSQVMIGNVCIHGW